LKKQIHSFNPKLEFINYKKSSSKQLNLKVSLYEVIDLKNFGVKNLGDKLGIRLFPLVKDKQYIYQNTTLGYFETFLKETAFLATKDVDSENYKAILLFRNQDLRSISYDKKDKLLVQVGDLVRVGTFLTSNIKSCYSGQVYKFINNEILIRLGKPYLVSEGTIVRVKNGNFIKDGGTLATLVYKKLKTADIVQGLPKVEEILEARKIINACLLSPAPGSIVSISQNCLQLLNSKNEKIDIQRPSNNSASFLNFKIGDFVDVAEPLTEGPISPHMKLQVLFNYHQTIYPILKACQASFKNLQLFLVSEIQQTYSSQGVDIADKHIEVIVKQMTSKVCIEDSGNTTFLPGEIISLQKIETLTNVLNVNDENMPTYTPVLLGITKASLNIDSFISAASFQETTRVLTESAIEGKKDWLNGLKENVIIGRLSPAGTGFNYNENRMMLKREVKELESSFKKDVKEVKTNILNFTDNF
jgi:DNA-directed RNA polymerase subunit beta'